MAKKIRPDLVKDGSLPKDLEDFLNKIEVYAERVDGSIQSRQVAALALAMWDLIKDKE